MALSKAAVPALVIRQEPDPEPTASNVVVIVKAKAPLPLPQPVNSPGHQTGGYLLSGCLLTGRMAGMAASTRLIEAGAPLRKRQP